MSNRIRDMREHRGLSQEALAEKCVPKTSKAQIGKLEKDDRRLTDRWMYRLSRALECHPAELLADNAALKPDEAKLLDTYRGLAEDGRETVQRFLDAFPEEPKASQG